MYDAFTFYDIIISILTIGFILFIPLMIIGIIYTISLWYFFKKCGYEGWKALIPFYNTFILLKISGLNSWYFLLIYANVITSILGLEVFWGIANVGSLVANFFMYYNISKKVHKDILFSVLLFLFPFVMIPILAFKKDNIFDDSVKVSPNGPIGDNETNNVFDKYCRHCGNGLSNNANYCNKCGSKVNEE